MNPLIRNIARTGLAACSVLGVTSIARRSQSGACILMYHGLTKGRYKGLENHSRLHLDIGGFRKSAAVFAKHYNVIPLQELADMIVAGEKIPNNTVVLTFDDGYASNYHLGLPVLEEFGLHATIFVTTAFVEREMFQWPDRIEYAIDHTTEKRLLLDFKCLPAELGLGSREEKKRALITLDAALKCVPQDHHLESIAHVEERAGISLLNEPNPSNIYQPLNWEQLRALHASDFAEIGAHTHTHPILGKCTPEFAREDMERCLELLKTKGGVENPTFAYPNGKRGDYTSSTEELLIDLGIKVAVTTETSFNSTRTSPLRLNRMGTPNDGYQADTICSGLVPFVKHQLDKVNPSLNPSNSYANNS